MPKRKNSEEVNKGGRPSKYSKELAEKICYLISTSSKSLRKICASNPGFPNPDTIYWWRATISEFSDMYFAAKKNQVVIYAEETIDIADDITNDDIIDNNGNLRPNNEWINRSKIRIATRQWHCARLMSKVFGDKSDSIPDESNVLKSLNEISLKVNDIMKSHERDY